MECANATLWQGKRAGSLPCCSGKSLVLLFPVFLPFSSSSCAHNIYQFCPTLPGNVYTDEDQNSHSHCDLKAVSSK